MKIITCAPLPPPNGGIANWYNILCSEGKEKGYTFLNINTSPKKSIDGRSIFYRIVIQGFRMLIQRMELARLIKKNPDARVAHIATSGSFALVRDILFLRLLKKKHIKSIYHIHFGRVPQIFSKNGWEQSLFKKAISLADDIIAIDPKTYNVLSDLNSGVKVYYIPNPVKKVNSETEKSNNNVVFLGNVLSTKGVEELLQAWGNITDKYPQWSLTLAGYCEEEYKAYITTQYPTKNVSFLGFLEHDKAMELLSQAAFLVLPSYTEGFPNVVIEAMMCKKPVIATDVGAIKDILSGGCGIVIHPKNVSELIDSMETLITDKDLRESMGQCGNEKALSHYASDIVLKQYEALWLN